MNPLYRPITLTLTLQEVSRLTSLLKHHIEDLQGQYEIIPEDTPHIDADIAIAQQMLTTLQEAIEK